MPRAPDQTTLATPSEASRAEAHRRWLVLRAHLEDGVPLTRVAAQCGIPRQTLQRWLARYQAGGLAGLGRPDVSQTVDRDLDITGRLAARLECRTGWGRAVGAVGLAAGFAAALREELDLRIEARNMTSVAAASGSGGIAIPVPHRPLCTAQC
jgi:transposase-like protein